MQLLSCRGHGTAATGQPPIRPPRNARYVQAQGLLQRLQDHVYCVCFIVRTKLTELSVLAGWLGVEVVFYVSTDPPGNPL